MNGWMDVSSGGPDFGIVLLDEARRPTFANRRARELLGGDDDLARLWPRLAARLEAAAGGALWDAGASAVTAELPAGDGERAIQVEVLALDGDDGGDGGDGGGHLLVLRDRQRVEAAERDLWTASQMHSVARLYRAMAHDLRAPLNTIVVNLELLSDAVAADAVAADTKTGARPQSDLAARRRRYVRVLKEETERLSRQLLAFLAQTAPPRDADRQVDLRTLVEEMALFAGPQAAQQGTELSLLLPSAPLIVGGNPDRLRQALLSLLVNALEAVAGDAPDRAAGGRVEISLAVEGDGDGARAVLTVSDDGPGLPQAADRLFELHYTTKPEASGIGLTVARRIAECHGGSLTVVPATAGARFRLALPLTPRQEA